MTETYLNQTTVILALRAIALISLQIFFLYASFSKYIAVFISEGRIKLHFIIL